MKKVPAKYRKKKLFKTHEQRWYEYIAYQKKFKGLKSWSMTTAGGFDNPSHQAKEMLMFSRDADNPKKRTRITNL